MARYSMVSAFAKTMALVAFLSTTALSRPTLPLFVSSNLCAQKISSRSDKAPLIKVSNNGIRYPSLLRNDLRDEIEKSARQKAYENKARGEGTGSVVGGAILGGILGGPFGALFGAQIGAAFGDAKTIDKARMEEMKRKGLTPEMLEMASDVGMALEQAVEGLRATQESVNTSQRLARSLEQQSDSLYERAKAAMDSGNEGNARTFLMEREKLKEKLVKVLKSTAEDRKRLMVMEGNVNALETRALEIESLLRRSVGASSLKDSAMSELSLEPEDPLIKKFRELGM